MMSSVAIVTGGSRGIGKAVSVALGRAGCRVVVNYLNSSRAAEEVCALVEAAGGRALPFRADVSDEAEVRSMFKEVEKSWGPPTILVNNAGMNADRLAVKTNTEEFSRVLDTNLVGPFICSREAIKTMLVQRKGRIVNIASVIGQIGNAGQSGYSASKAGLIGLTRSLAKEYGGRGICVNAVCPGYIESDMTKQLNTSNILKNIPLNRFGKPEEVAGLVEFLALSDSAAYITGHCFNIDGGLAIGAT